MQIVQINATYGKGSTGKICLGISELLNAEGRDNCILYSLSGIEGLSGVKYSNGRYIKLQALRSRIKGNYGFNSAKSTRTLINKLEELAPKIVHIHNIHSHDCNFEILLSYLKEKRIKTVWTFHDCWAFTGYCPHFVMAGCEQWQKGCMRCPQRKQFSWFFDRSQKLHNLKKAAFDGLDLTIVTPSRWLADMVGKSFLAEYPVKTIYNGINLDIFKPTLSTSGLVSVRDTEKMILGIADVWSNRKGLDVFLRLAERLPDNYRIVIVGTNDKIDKALPDNIISVHRTNDQQQLAELYTMADLFVNPTREEVLGLTNIEANACGTPVVTFRTGGSPECIDETSGSVVDCDDVDALEKEIIRICETNPYSREACIKRAEKFDQNKRFMEYVELYNELL